MTPGQKRDACRFPTCAPLACVIPLHSPCRGLPYSSSSSFFFFCSFRLRDFFPLFDQPRRCSRLFVVPFPPWRSTSRRMTCASRDVTSMCHENPRDVGRARGHGVISLFSFFVALFVLENSLLPP